MDNLKEGTIERINLLAITKFLGLAFLISLIPFYIHLQYFSGPLINAILIITLFIVGVREAFILALVPSLMALSGGLLPSILAPLIPFIMLSNVIFIYLIDRFFFIFRSDKYSYWFSLFIASLAKFLFLYFSLNIISKILIKEDLILKVAEMMSWPQFFTAFSGGMIAFIFLRFIKRI